MEKIESPLRARGTVGERSLPSLPSFPTMDVLIPASPFLSNMPDPTSVNAALLYESGFAESMAQMLWLINELAYFVRNPLAPASFNLLGPLRFRTHWVDKMYLIRLYKLADFLCMSEEILNAIALACFECFFLTEKWAAATFPHQLETRLRTLWGTFVEKYLIVLHIQNTFTAYYPTSFTAEAHVRHTCDIPHYLHPEDLQDAFGQKTRWIVQELRSQESAPRTYNLSHFVLPHEQTYTMDDLLPYVRKACIGDLMDVSVSNMELLRNNMETLCETYRTREASIARAAAEGHDMHTCTCETCLNTHIHCACPHHYDETEFENLEDDYYEEPDYGYLAELAWERHHGDW